MTWLLGRCIGPALWRLADGIYVVSRLIDRAGEAVNQLGHGAVGVACEIDELRSELRDEMRRAGAPS